MHWPQPPREPTVYKPVVGKNGRASGKITRGTKCLCFNAPYTFFVLEQQGRVPGILVDFDHEGYLLQIFGQRGGVRSWGPLRLNGSPLLGLGFFSDSFELEINYRPVTFAAFKLLRIIFFACTASASRWGHAAAAGPPHAVLRDHPTERPRGGQLLPRGQTVWTEWGGEG